jgi:hypothetical protein
MRMADFKPVSLSQGVPPDAIGVSVAAMRRIGELDVRSGFAQRQPG